MAVSATEREHVCGLLLRDVAATLGAGHEAVVLATAVSQQRLTADLADFTQQLVDDIQQYFHDSFIDTSWPKCPRHPGHPLWFDDGWWRCERDAVAIAELGELAAGNG